MHWRRYTHPIPLKMRILFQELMTCLRKEYPSVLTRILKLDILISLPNVFQSPRMHNWTLWHLKCQRLGLYRPLLLSYSQVWRYSSFLELLCNTWLHMCEICIEWLSILYACIYLPTLLITLLGVDLSFLHDWNEQVVSTHYHWRGELWNFWTTLA